MNLFLADCPTIAAGSGFSASSSESLASAAPSTSRWPPLVRRVRSRPASAQRRTVSTLTPSSSAACPILNSAINRTLARGCGGVRYGSSPARDKWMACHMYQAAIDR